MDSLLKDIPFEDGIDNFKKLEGYGSINYWVKLKNNNDYLVKIFDKKESQLVNEVYRISNEIAKNISIEIPSIVSAFESFSNDEYLVKVSKYVDGVPFSENNLSKNVLQEIASKIAELDIALANKDSLIIKGYIHDWNLVNALNNYPKLDYIKSSEEKKIVAYYLDYFETIVFRKLNLLPSQIIHGDLNEENIIVKNDKLVGFIDFGDISFAPKVCELAIFLTYIGMMDLGNIEANFSTICNAYHKVNPLTKEEIELIYWLIGVRLSVSVLNSAEKKHQNLDTDYILKSEQPAWKMLHFWIALNPIKIQNLIAENCGINFSKPNYSTILNKRKVVASSSLSLSYDVPILMENSIFQYMKDGFGNTYLDAYNNIPHVGHCHPRISKRVSEQIRKLNTNTRYLYEIYNSYSEKLLNLFPEKLNKVLFVNSGSEASDLATRIARTVSNSPNIAVMEWGYHGNTQNGVNISSYKFDRKGGKGAQASILKITLPKEYLGKFKTEEEYLNDAIEKFEEFEKNNGKIAAFITEPISGCGGQVPLMGNFLEKLHHYLKSKNIYLIVDEVQTGFGRLGSWFWGFEMLGVVPDFVVLGKPIANGHPMGAVVTSHDITNKFTNGMEFFSSFGGNPVSCTIADEVLNIIKEEGLQENAKIVGNYWKDEIKKLQPEFPQIGDVRGEGLFIGFEMITSDFKEDTDVAQYLKNKLKEDFILASTDGPLDNVLKMKPAICFTKDNVNTFMISLKKHLKNYYKNMN